MQPETAQSRSIRVGDVVAGRYRVDDTLGSGSHGVVYAATHVALGQRVALKVLKVSVDEDAVIVDRFLREGEAVARLRSEHIVRLLETGAHDGVPFIATELLDGHDLARVARRVRLSTAAAVDYVAQACEGLRVAHGAGVVHRDLKPANLFLASQPSGRPIVKVLDFGICKVADDRQKLTRKNELLGTPLYMSPEQLVSTRDVDERTDVWALGVILYELLTQQVPFKGDRMTTLMRAIFETTQTTAHRLRVDIPEGLSAVVDRCLEKDPSRRFRSVGEVADALAPYAVDEEAEVSTHGPETAASELETQVRVVGRAPPTARIEHARLDPAASSEVERAPVSSAPVTPPTLVSGEAPVVAVAKPAPTTGRRARATEQAVDLGRYVMCGPLASGGMASVHYGAIKADDGALSVVALKRLRSDITDPKYETMLRDEARITARVRHPNVVATLDIVAHEGEIIIVLEHVLGVSLSEALRAAASAMPERVAIGVAIGVLHGLQAAHEATDLLGQPLEIVHRDVSPQNILLDEGGRARVADFGIATARGRLQRTTEAGAVKGKLGYLAPEQLHGEASPAVDVYACGAVLWEMLAGRPLFVGSDPEILAATLLGRIPAPSTVTTGVSPALDAVVLKALARTPAERFASAAEMAAALEALGPATERETGAWLASSVGDEIEARRAAAQGVLQQVAARPAAAAPAARSSSPLPLPRADAPARARRVWPVVGAAGFGLAAALGVVAVLPSAKAPSASSGPAPSLASSSAEPSDVRGESSAPIASGESSATALPPPASAVPAAEEPPAHAPARKRSKPPPPNCKVPYTVDAEGRTIWRRECFKR